ASEQHLSCNQLITQIDEKREKENLSAAIRVYILQYYKNKVGK
ncbi:MAG: ribbon-helix-helix domain-containing protein, partial [Alphaproteobacteria bacterium]|nr:ribbon-helix-helix domain-containing protein [Alphaproteobacteria bacterium]